MSPIHDAMSEAVVQRIGWALVHFLWQGAAVAVLLAAALALLRRRSAAARYAACCAALALMAALPLATAMVVPDEAPAIAAADLLTPASAAGATPDDASFDGAQQVAPLPPQADIAALPPLEPVDLDALARSLRPQPSSAATGAAASHAAPAGIHSWWRRAADACRPALPWAVSLWLLGVAMLSLWHLAGWCQVQRLKHRGTQPVSETISKALAVLVRRLRVSRPVRAVQSAIVAVPAVVGWLRPAVLLPAAALAGLSPAQLEALLAHELAHVRRWDYLVNLLQTLVETLLFYHPAVWWVSHRMRAEREHCCDDLAIAAGADRAAYARALAHLAERSEAAPHLAAAASGGGPLLGRIRRILGRPSQHSPRAGTWLTGLVLLSLAVALGANLFLRTATGEDAPEKVRTIRLVVTQEYQLDPSARDPADVSLPIAAEAARTMLQAAGLEVVAEGAKADATVNVHLAGTYSLRREGGDADPDEYFTATLRATCTLSARGATESATIEPENPEEETWPTDQPPAEAIAERFGQLNFCGGFASLIGRSLDLPARPQLMALAGHADRGIRCQVARGLGELKDPEAVPDLINMLQDEDVHVQGAAAQGLGHTGDPRGVRPLAVMLKGSNENFFPQRHFYHGLYMYPEAVFVPEVLKLLGDPDAAVRLVGVRLLRHRSVMGLGGMKGQLAEAVLPLLDDADELVVAAAVDLLQSLDAEKAVKPILKLLESGTPAVKIQAAEAVAWFRCAAAAETLLALLQDPAEREEVRGAAASALGELKHLPALEPLIAALDGAGSRLRGAIAYALCDLEDPRGNKVVISLLADPDDSVKKDAASALGDGRKHPEAVEPLAALLKHSNKDIRAYATIALGNIGDPRAVPHVVATLNDRNETQYVRQWAMRSLAQLDRKQALAWAQAGLKSDDDRTRSLAAMMLNETRPEGPAEARETVDALLAAMNDSSEEVVAQAANALGRLGDLRAGEPLLKALRTGQDDLKCAAAGALGELRYAKAFDDLVAILQNPDEDEMVAGAAASALGQLGGPRAVAPLVAALKHRCESVRTQAAYYLGEVGDGRPVTALIEALEDPSRDVRQYARQSLAGMSWADCDPKSLAAALKSTDPKLRYWAVSAIGQVRRADAVGVLVAVLADPTFKPMPDPDMEVSTVTVGGKPFAELDEGERQQALLRLSGAHPRIGAAEALGEIRDPRTIGPLADALRDDDEQLRDAAADALARFGPAALQAALAALIDEKADVRTRGAYILGRIGDPRAAEPLKAALKDADSRVRVNAACSLLKLDAPDVVPPVLPLLKDEDAQVRWSVAEALAQRRDPRCLDTLATLLTDEAEYVAVAAARGLEALGDERAVEPLRRAMKSPTPWLRTVAAASLVERGEPGALDVLLAAVEDPGPEVRSDAAEGLGRSKDRRAIDALVAMACDQKDQFSVRSAALRALIACGDPKGPATLLLLAHRGDDVVWGYDTPETSLIPSLEGASGKLLIDALGDDRACFLAGDLLAAAGEAAVPLLIAALDHEKPDVRQEALDLLVRSKDARAVRPILGHLRLAGAQADTRSTCASLVAFGPVAVEPLIELLADGDVSLRCLAAEILGGIGDARAAAPLATLLADESPAARWQAAVALGETGDRSGLPALEQAAKGDKDFDVRRAAAEAAKKLAKLPPADKAGGKGASGAGAKAGDRIDNAGGDAKAGDPAARFSLHVYEMVWGEPGVDVATVAARQLLWLDTSFRSLATAPMIGYQVTREEAERIREALKASGIADKPRSRRTDFPAGTIVLETRGGHVPLAPGAEGLKVLRDVRQALAPGGADGQQRTHAAEALDALLAMLGAEAVGGLAAQMDVKAVVPLGGEPSVVMTLRLRNVGDKPLRLMRLSDRARFWGDCLPLRVRTAEGVLRYKGPVLDPPPPPGRAAYIDLPPGEVDQVETAMNPRHWGLKSLDGVELAFVFVNLSAHDPCEFDHQTRTWLTVDGLWTGEVRSRPVALDDDRVEVLPGGKDAGGAADGAGGPKPVVVQVRDAETGRPLTAFSCSYWIETPGSRERHQQSPWQAVESPEGELRLDAPPSCELNIEVKAADYIDPGYGNIRSFAIGPDDPQRRVTVTLTPGMTLRGHVRDAASGKPVAGASIAPIIFMSPLFRPDHERIVTSGPDGAFEVRAVDPTLGIEVWHDDYVSTEPELPQPPEGGRLPRELQINVLLATAPAVHGVVADPEGKPIEGVEVSDGAGKTVLSDAKGKFIIRSASKSRWSDDGEEYWIDFSADRATQGRFLDRTVTVKDVPAAGLRVVLARAPVMSGTVLAADGRPQAAYEIIAAPAEDLESWTSVRRTVSDPAGGFSFPLSAEGRHWVAVRTEGHAPWETFVEAGDLARPLTVKLSRGVAVSGRVVVPAGKAVGAAVRLRPPLAEARGDFLAIHASADADGTFRIEHVAPGPYVLSAWAERATPARLDVAVPEAGLELGEVRLRGTGRIAGSVAHKNLSRLGAFADGEVRHPLLEEPISLKADAAGRFVVENVPVGEVEISFPYLVTSDIIDAVTRSVEVAENETTRVVISDVEPKPGPEPGEAKAENPAAAAGAMTLRDAEGKEMLAVCDAKAAKIVFYHFVPDRKDLTKTAEWSWAGKDPIPLEITLHSVPEKKEASRITVAGMGLADNESLRTLLKGFADAMRAADLDPRAKVVVTIAPDSLIWHKHVVAAFDACVDAGFSKIQFTVPKDDPGPAKHAGPWGEAAKGLAGQVILERATFVQGRPIEARAVVRNFGREPVSYDPRCVDYARMGHYTLLSVVGPDGQPAPDISAPVQFTVNTDGSYAFPVLPAGESVRVAADRLDRHFHMLRPGRYRITWRGARAAPANVGSFLALDDADVGRVLEPMEHGPAADLPPSGVAEILVVPAPGGERDPDMLSPVLAVLPPSWKVNGAELFAERIVPPGRQAGRGSAIGLVHRPVAGMLANNAFMWLYVMDEQAVADEIIVLPADPPATYLGKGKWGHVYLAAGSGGPLDRWNHAASDLAAALGVAQPEVNRPAVPDWGRMMSCILAELQKDPAGDEGGLAEEICFAAGLSPREGEAAFLRYFRPREIRPVDRPPPSPHFEVELSIRPWADDHRDAAPGAGAAAGWQDWDGKAIKRICSLSGLRVDVIITVNVEQSPAFAWAVNAIFDRQIRRAIARLGDE